MTSEIKPLVLIAEDDPFTRRLVEVTVKNAGYEVISVSDGEQALARICADRPALAILDVQMPRLTGWEVGKELKARLKDSPTRIIFLTSHTQERDVLEGFKAGATDYLFKPFSPRELKARIKAVLGKR